MDIRLNTTVREFRGDGRLSSVLVEDLTAGRQEELHPAGVFVFIGLDPNTDFLSGVVDLDQRVHRHRVGHGNQPPRYLRRRDAPRRQHQGRWPRPWGEGAAALIAIRAHLEDEIRNRGYAGDG